MPKRICIPIVILLTIFLTACPNPDPGPSRITPNSPDESGEQPSGTIQPDNPDTGVTLPFTLRVNGEIISTDLEASVSESEISTIDISSPGILDGNIRVVHPDSTSIPLGEWQADQAQFIHSFPYGENHLVIRVEETEYDILIVSGAPQITPPGQDCANPFFDYSPGAVSTLTETSEDELPATWTHQIVGAFKYEDNNICLLYTSDAADE